MQKDARIKKTKKNPSEPNPEGLKPKAKKCKKTLDVKKTEKNPSEPRPHGLKPKGIKCKRHWKSKNKKKIHRSLNQRALKQRK